MNEEHRHQRPIRRAIHLLLHDDRAGIEVGGDLEGRDDLARAGIRVGHVRDGRAVERVDGVSDALAPGVGRGRDHRRAVQQGDERPERHVPLPPAGVRPDREP